MLSRYAVALVLSLLVLYGFIEAWPLLAGPSLSIESPADGSVATSSVVTISGTALRVVNLSLDGAALYPDRSGHFSTSLAFASGTSILTFTATDRFGRHISKTRTIFVP